MSQVSDFDRMVDRFLSWKLPDDVRADDCATMQGYPHRTGTCLLTDQQTRQMLRHVLEMDQADGPERRVTQRRVKDISAHLDYDGPSRRMARLDRRKTEPSSA